MATRVLPGLHPPKILIPGLVLGLAPVTFRNAAAQAEPEVHKDGISVHRDRRGDSSNG